MKLQSYNIATLAAAVVVAAPQCLPAQALSLDEIIVTAQLRAQSLQQVPVSVSTMAGNRLLESGINNLEAMTPYVPNFSMNQTAIGSNITIRGISSGINQGFEQSVGMYVDGIYYGRAQLTRAPLFDLQRIEVLRGPQPILFGKNSIAGAVSQLTKRPSFAVDGFASLGYTPQFNEQDYRLAIGGGLSDTLAGRISTLYRSGDGWIENTFSGDDDPNSEESVIRGSLLWEASEQLSFWLKAEHSKWNVNGRNVEVHNSITNPDPGVVTQPGGALPAGIQVDHISALNGAQSALGRPAVDGLLNFKRDSNGDSSDNSANNITLNIDLETGSVGSLTLVTGYVAYDYEELCDCDFTGASIFYAVTEEDYSQLSQEIRFTSAVGGFVDYITGLYFQTSELDYRDNVSVPPDSILIPGTPAIASTSSRRQFSQDTRLWSGFGQLTLNFSDSLRLTLGGRFSSEHKEATRIQSHFAANGSDQGSTNLGLNTIYNAFGIEPYDTIKDERNETNFSPLVTLQWDLSSSLMLYASAVQGFKSGGYDVRSNAHPNPTVVSAGTDPALVGAFEFDPEQARSFEVGAKTTFLEGRAELNLAVFRTDYSDLQSSQFDGGLGFNVTNAGEAYSQGLEADFRWLLASSFAVSGNLAYLDFQYTDFPNAQCYFGQSYLEPGTVTDPVKGLCDADGKRKEYTPEWRGTLTGDWLVELGNYFELRAVLDLMFVDSYLWSPTLDPRSEQDAYTRIDARISLGSQDGKWVVALVGKNLSDETIIDFGGDTALAGTLTQDTGNSYYSFVQRPASIGLQATYNFF